MAIMTKRNAELVQWLRPEFPDIIGGGAGYIILGRGYLGREEGPRVGFRLLKGTGPDGTDIIAFELIDTSNDVVATLNGLDYRTNSTKIRFGYEDQPSIYLEDPKSAAGDVEQHRRMVVDIETLSRLLTHEFIDLHDLQANLGMLYGATLPEAMLYPTGTLFYLQSPGDLNIGVLYIRDFLDGWQLLIGAGYAAPHTHTSSDTGGVLTPMAVPGTMLEPLVMGNEIIMFGGDVLTMGVGL